MKNPSVLEGFEKSVWGGLGVDAGDLAGGEALAVAGFALVGVLWAELVDEDFVAFDHWFDDLEGDGCALDVGSADFGVASDGACDEDFVDGDGVTGFGFAAFVEVDENLVVYIDDALSAGLFDDCVVVSHLMCSDQLPHGGLGAAVAALARPIAGSR